MDEPLPTPLELLLAGITKENRHGEWDMGTDVGGEAWQGMASLPERGTSSSLLLSQSQALMLSPD